jgi:hypothetical protein
MKRNNLFLISLGLTLMVIPGIYSCRTTGQGTKDTETVTEELVSNQGDSGVPVTLQLTKGKSFNYPTLAVWLEDISGHFLQTLFVTKSFGSGTFTFGNASEGKWKPGQVRRPAALPYWSHRAGAAQGVSNYVPDADHPVSDALTGATPKGSFLLKTRGNNENQQIVKLFLEINQTWDWNSFWTNHKYPGDSEYKTSCQPAVVYAAEIDLSKRGLSYTLVPVGRSSHNGSDGNLYSDLETLTTALHIAEKITATIGVHP